MTFWITLWTGLLILGLLIYAGVALAVSVGGLFDIRSMFRRLDEQHRAGRGDGPGEGSA